MHKKLILFADGGARGNPGPAGSGAVLYSKDGKEIATVSKYIGNTTNNQAEYTAIVLGLSKAMELEAEEVDVYLDSELAVKQLNGQYKVKNPEIAKRFLEVHNLRLKFRNVRFSHVRREKNSRADELVNNAIDEAMKKVV
ncbi:MAG: ribonuclease H [uncultured bacterium]|nr:MAG: ribonuclease H [uncultured bacterium]HBD05685.1 ribonuclease H [Candidatus Uhrbacteria bacterium]